MTAEAFLISLRPFSDQVSPGTMKSYSENCCTRDEICVEAFLLREREERKLSSMRKSFSRDKTWLKSFSSGGLVRAHDRKNYNTNSISMVRCTNAALLWFFFRFLRFSRFGGEKNANGNINHVQYRTSVELNVKFKTTFNYQPTLGMNSLSTFSWNNLEVYMN